MSHPTKHNSSHLTSSSNKMTRYTTHIVCILTMPMYCLNLFIHEINFIKLLYENDQNTDAGYRVSSKV